MIKKTEYSGQQVVDKKPHNERRHVRTAPHWLSAGTLKAKPGFTLIEMMVAVTLFAIVMMVGVGALLSLVEANRRAQAINSVMNNLNAALESMTRSIRVGTNYHCDSWNTLINITAARDCPGTGGQLLAFESSSGAPSNPDDQVVYRLNALSKQLERSLDSGATWVALTAPEVSIDSFEFFVIGAQSLSGGGNQEQPRVLMRIKGSAPVPGGNTDFNVQASVVQRILDI